MGLLGLNPSFGLRCAKEKNEEGGLSLAALFAKSR